MTSPFIYIFIFTFVRYRVLVLLLLLLLLLGVVLYIYIHMLTCAMRGRLNCSVLRRKSSTTRFAASLTTNRRSVKFR